ncbi:MAG: hypothetical protein ACYC96_04980 [Fimbriimonadaceae bacterium]
MKWKRNNESASEAGKPSIDELLASEAQQMVMLTVRALPEDVPSMAWRGALNGRLAEQVARQRSRRRLWWVVSPSFGVAVAAVVCVAVFLPGHKPAGRQPVVPPALSLEDQLFASHRDSVTTQDVVGSSLSSQEVQQSADDSGSEGKPTS